MKKIYLQKPIKDKKKTVQFYFAESIIAPNYGYSTWQDEMSGLMVNTKERVTDPDQVWDPRLRRTLNK